MLSPETSREVHQEPDLDRLDTDAEVGSGGGEIDCVSACNLDPLIGGIGVQSCPPCHEA